MRYLLFLLTLGLAACVLVALGLWQVQRGQQKQTLIALLEARMAAPPLASLNQSAPNLAFRRVHIEGVIGDDTLRLYALDRRAGPGWRIIAPLALAQGRYLLADLGFVPEGQESPPLPQGEVYSGILLPSQSPALFDPPPNRAARQWFSRDAVSMSHALNLSPPARFFLHLEGQGGGFIRRPYALNLPDNHTSYALTWFSLAVVALIMLGIFLYRGRV